MYCDSAKITEAQLFVSCAFLGCASGWQHFTLMSHEYFARDQTSGNSK